MPRSRGERTERTREREGELALPVRNACLPAAATPRTAPHTQIQRRMTAHHTNGSARGTGVERATSHGPPLTLHSSMVLPLAAKRGR